MSDQVALTPEQLEVLADSVAQKVVTASRPRLVDADAIADMLGVEDSWVLAQARKDLIPHVRLGRYVRFEPDAVVAWWRDRASGPRVRTGSQPVSRGGGRP